MQLRSIAAAYVFLLRAPGTMKLWHDRISHWAQQGASMRERGGQRIVACFGDLRTEYLALANGPAIVDRSHRGLLEISGADRATWLHNLTTNQIKPLRSGEGNYVFCCSQQGRILFDAVVLVRPECCWMDMDRGFIDTAKAHLGKYIITEDVAIADRSDEFLRFALSGAKSGDLLTEMGIPHGANLAAYGQAAATLHGVEVLVARHDFCGCFAVDVWAPAADAVAVWDWMTSSDRATPGVPCGDDAVDVRRIEAGIPQPHAEITEEYLPAETGQFDRAVSYQKGCYLGQEVVERMRSRDVVARRLTGIEVNGDSVPPIGAELERDDNIVGQVTSARHSLALNAPLALAYVKTQAAADGTALTITWEGRKTSAVVRSLPVAVR